MILGIGIDLVDLKRIEKLASQKFINRILSVEEKEVYDQITSDQVKISYLGGRFAAKEAIFKAIASGPGTTNFNDFSVLNHENGSPYVKTEFFKNHEIVHISITHTDQEAIAYVVIEKL